MTPLELTQRATEYAEVGRFLSRCAAPRFRSMRRFAEQEIVIPNGPHSGKLFDVSRQPYSAAWFDLVDSGLWNRHFATGCTQSGKTLSCFIIPIMYHLFEMQETVICLVPQMEMARDKWNEDLLPAIEASRYRHMLPKMGAGSKGGAVESVRFQNGVTLKFMSGGGSDKKRSAFTSRVVVITEVDGMDVAGEQSREADKITQVEARTLAFGSRKRIYGECTVSIETGRTWQEYTKGTATRLVVQCHSCYAWVTPEREDLFGWHDAENVLQAGEEGRFACPSCGILWDDRQRETANRRARVVHRGQEIIDDQVVGDAPQTDTLGFRWNAFNNLFWKTSDIAAGEWRASKAENQDNAEKEQLQFKWAKPYIPDLTAMLPIDQMAVMARAGSTPRGVIPSGTIQLSLGCDLGMYLDHWCLVAWMHGAVCQVVDYGTIDVASRTVGVERATLIGLNELMDLCEAGWCNPDGTKRSPDRVFIDSGYQSHQVYSFIRQHGGGRYWAADGRGQSQDGAQGYHHPLQITDKTPLIGENYHVSVLDTGMIVAIDANEWKTWAHKRLTTPIGLPGAMTLFAGTGSSHAEFAKHVTAERQMEEFKPGKGYIKVWQRQHKKNHWFDALYYACCAGHLAGARVIDASLSAPPAPAKPLETERPFVRPATTQNEDGGWIRRRA